MVSPTHISTASEAGASRAGPSAADKSTAKPPLLELHDVWKSYGRRVALRGVTLGVPGGACLALLGPNGAGKSTLLRLAAGLARPTAGHLLVEGSPAQAAARLRPRVGYVAHQTLLYDALTARQNLAFFARVHGVPDPEARTARLLAEVGLERHADRAVAAFSRGMQQRLALARALAHAPSLLILDEPATGLDADGVRRLGRLLEEARARGATLVVATHAPESFPDVADQVAILVAGELRHHGSRPPGGAAGLAALYAEVVGGEAPAQAAPSSDPRPPAEAAEGRDRGSPATGRDHGRPVASGDTAGRVTARGGLARARALLAKDLLVEWRRKERVAAMAAFAFLAGVLFVFAVDPAPAELARLGPGALWISFLFAATLGLAKAFAPEERNGALTALLLAPVDRTVLFLAKASSATLLVLVMEALMTPVFVAMFGLPLPGVLGRFAATAALATVGFCLVGTLLAFATARSAARELLMPLLLLPLTLPLLIAAAKATRILLAPEAAPIADWHLWVTLMGTYDVVFGVLCCWGFERAVEE